MTVENIMPNKYSTNTCWRESRWISFCHRLCPYNNIKHKQDVESGCHRLNLFFSLLSFFPSSCANCFQWVTGRKLDVELKREKKKHPNHLCIDCDHFS